MSQKKCPFVRRDPISLKGVPRILIGCSVFSFSWYENSSSYKDEYRQEIKRSFCNAVKSLVWMWIQLNRPTFLNFLLATHIPLEPTDSTSLSLWVQKLKILATFKRLHLNERNKIVCTQSFSDVTGFTANPVLQTEWYPVRHRKYLAWMQRSDMPCRENQWET